MNAVRLRTAALVNLAMVVEQANEQVLPAVYLFVGRSLNATPVQLGTLTLCRAMVQTLASPLSGILGDRYDRVLVLSSGAFIWGIMTSAMALTVTLRQAMAFAGFNGLGLALLVPCCQSLIADLYAAEQRGRAFGTLQLTASLGGMMGGVFATNMGGLRPLGMDGWRAAFHCIAALSLLVGSLALFFAADPRRMRGLYSLLPATDVNINTLIAATPPAATAAAATPPLSPGAHAAVTTAGDGGAEGVGGDLQGSGLKGSGLAALPGIAGVLIERRRSFNTPAGTTYSSTKPLLAAADGGGGSVGDGPGGDVGGVGGRTLLYRPHHVAVSGKAGEQLLLHNSKQDQNSQPPHLTHSSSHQQPHTTSHQQQQHQHHQDHHQHHDRGPGSGYVVGSGGSGGSQLAGSYHHKVSDDGGVDVRGRDKGRKRGVVADICWMLRIRTFQAIVLQGIVGCFPWQAMVFFTLWLQLNGFTDSVASLLVATFGAGVAGGALLGGSVGDRMAKRLPNNGRILTAQFSVFCGIPLTWLLLKGLPGSVFATEALAYACVMFTMGLTCTWAGAGCNSPIFAEIVPDELRSTIYAFDRSFENSIAACAAPVVGLLAERVFGFSGVLSDAVLKDDVLRNKNAAALGSSLLACMAVPWSLCLVFYTFLHWCYPHDKAVARTWGGQSSCNRAVFHH